MYDKIESSTNASKNIQNSHRFQLVPSGTLQALSHLFKEILKSESRFKISKLINQPIKLLINK